MVRTRTDAAKLTEAGFVRLNGARVAAPSAVVRLGDVVTLALDRSVRVIKVAGFCERRGQAQAARALYRDMRGAEWGQFGAIRGLARRDAALLAAFPSLR